MKVCYEMSCTLFNSSSLCTWHITLSFFFGDMGVLMKYRDDCPRMIAVCNLYVLPFKKYEWPFYLGILCLNHQLIIYFYRIIIVIILNEPLID